MDMSHIAGIVGLISGLITIVSAGVAVTRYFRRHPEFLKVCIDFLEGAVFSAIVVALVGGLVFGLGFVAVNGVDFVASKIRSPAPTPTDIVTPTPSFTLPYQNSLLSQAARWTTDDSHNCFWGDGGLHVLGNDRCYPPVGEPSDVTITVQVSQIAGAADVYYGVTIRLIPESPSLFFGINSAGYWEVVDCDPEKCTTLIDDPSSAIHLGLSAVNIIEVIAKGTTIQQFVNGQQVGTTTNVSANAGQVALGCGGSGSECVYSNISLSVPE